MPNNHEAIFPGLKTERSIHGWFGMIMKNGSGATPITSGDFVCFYSGATGGATWLKVKLMKAVDTKCGGGSTFAKTASRKVTGRAMEDIGTFTTGRVAMCGPMPLAPATSTVGQYLRLSDTNAGVLTGAATSLRGTGRIVGFFMGITSTVGVPTGFIYPFRM